MRVLKNAGDFTLLTSEEDLQKQLLVIERAGRTCYRSWGKGEITLETAQKFIKMILRRGHEGVLEHSNMTVEFRNISRGFTHEQVRHRLTAISQESTRYVDYAQKLDDEVALDLFQIRFIMPPARDEYEKHFLEDGRRLSANEMAQEIEKYYRTLRKAGWPPEDARQFLPIGVKSQIVISANFREWRHIFKMRTDKAAHWEIRGVMGNLLERVRPILSPVFDDFIWSGAHKHAEFWIQKEGYFTNDDVQLSEGGAT